MYRARLKRQILTALGGLDLEVAGTNAGVEGFDFLETDWEAVSVFRFLAGSNWLVCLVHC